MKKNGCFIFLVLTYLGCARPAQTGNISISLIDNDRSVQISGFDKMVIADISRDTSNEAWESLLPVYKMPADTGMKDFQNTQPGKYLVKDSLVIFSPDTPFRKGQVYFVRSYEYGDTKSAWDFIRQKKQKGNTGHKDLLFKY
jgi:hypothetical protein